MRHYNACKLEAFSMVVLAASLLGAQSLLAQDSRAGISGRVMDPSRAAIPGAMVTATNVATSVPTSSVTNAEGDYNIRYLNPGKYTLTARHTGFENVSEAVELTAGDQMRLDLTMPLGKVTQTVSVTSKAALLKTTNANQGEVIGSDRVNSIPLAEGNTLFLLTLAPSMNPGTGSDPYESDEPTYQVSEDFSFNGGPAGTNQFTLDGFPNTVPEFGDAQSAVAQPPTDAVQEFNISQTYDASVGHSTGSTVDVVLKPGTNGVHGSLYGFVRRSAWGANDFIDNLAGNPKAVNNYRRIGGSFQGPLHIPHVYDGRNKTFFAISYENSAETNNELTSTVTIPTPAELNGDFSQLLAFGPQYQVYNPFSTTPTGSGFYQRTPFTGNIIPQSMISPIAGILAQYWPKPNLPGGANGSNNFKPNTPSPTDWAQTFVRVDHNFSSNNKMFVQLGLLTSDIAWDDTYNTLASGHHQNITREIAGLDFVHVINSRMLAHFRLGLTRVADTRIDKSNISAPGGGYNITKLGLNPSLVSQLDLSQSSLPEVFISGYSGIHDNVRNNIDNPMTYTLEGQVDYDHGNHDIESGSDLWLINYNSANNQYTMPRYNFDSTYTNGPFNTSPAAPFGQSLAAFLLGQPSTGYIIRPANFAAHNYSFGFYAQDNWRATQKLTLNLGARYEHYTPVIERYNRSVRGFAYDSINPINAAASAAYENNPVPGLPANEFRTLGGLTFAGAGGQPRTLYSTSWRGFAPRIGFAYLLPENTVVRGGYGIYFVPVGLDGPGNLLPIQEGFSQQTALVPTLNNGVTFVANLENPFPNGILPAPGSSLGLSTFLGQSISFLNTTDLQSPYVQHWSMSLQHLFPSQTNVEISYVGSQSVHLITARNIDALPAQYLSTLPYRDQQTINNLTQAYPNPFAGLLPGTGLNTSETSLSQLLLPYPEFTSATLEQTNQGTSSYNSLQAQVEKRMTHGLTSIFAYTWSKWMDGTQYLNPTDPIPYRMVSPDDHTHILSLSAIYQLPFGASEPFASHPPAGINQIISGWEIAPVWHAVSGFPITFPNDLFVTNSFHPKDLSLPTNERAFQHWFNTDDGFVTDPAQQPEFHVRTFPLQFSGLRTAWVNFWDISLQKNTRLRENVTLQFQAQFLNAFNDSSWGPVDTNPTDGSFGSVTSEMTWPRRIMFGLRLFF